MPFLIFAGVRFSSAGLIILVVSRVMGWKFPEKFDDYRTIATVGIKLLFISNGLVCWAEQWINSGLTALLLAATPLIHGPDRGNSTS